MVSKKKEIRKAFRDACFKRDKYACVMCGFKSSPEKAMEDLDCHHICPREHMPAGGYVADNGISLCQRCHLKAEAILHNEYSDPDFSPFNLLEKIGSTYDKARAASKKLEEQK